MARAFVRRDDFVQGRLPDVCAKTGGDPDGFADVTFDSAPIWSWWLLLLGIIPFLVVAWLAREHVEGRLPLKRAVIERYRWLTRTGWVALAAGLVLIPVGLLSDAGPVLIGAGLVAVGVAIGAHVWATFAFPTGRPDDTGEWVELAHVDRGFAQIVHDGYGITV